MKLHVLKVGDSDGKSSNFYKVKHQVSHRRIQNGVIKLYTVIEPMPEDSKLQKVVTKHV